MKSTVRMGILFTIGSFCFMLGAFAPYYEHLDATVVAATFFVGSIFFTTAATLQERAARAPGRPMWSRDPDRLAWWSASTQWIGTFAFNLSTFAAIVQGLSAAQEKRLVWSPDAIGSVLFLVSGVAGVAAVSVVRTARRDRGMAWLNLLGSVFFGLSAIGAYVIPDTGDLYNLRWANSGTFLGGVCFFAASIWLARPPAAERTQSVGGSSPGAASPSC
jgi:hypothetical protein